MKHQKFYKRIYQYFSKNYKTVILIFTFFLGVLMMLSLAYLIMYKKTVKENITASIEQTMQQASYNIDNTLSSVKFTMEFMATSDDVLKQIVYEEGEGSYQDQIHTFKEAWDMAVVVENYRHICGVQFYIDDRKAVSKEHVNYFGWEDAKKESWYPALMEKEGGMYWMPPYRVGDQDNSMSIFSCVSTIKNYKKEITQPIAIVKLDCESREIYKALDAVNIAQSTAIGICDANGQVIFCEKEDMLGKKISEDGFLMKTDQVIYAEIPTTGWKIFGVIPEKALSYDSVSVMDIVLMTLAIIMFVVLLIALVFAKFSETFIRRVSSLISDFEERPENGDIIDTKLEAILNHYRQMIAQKYEGEALIREAELKALQSQINPHFLYNTLDSINWLVKNEDNEGAERMIGELAQYFRFSLSKGKDIVTIRDEVEIANIYISIQKHRFGHEFEYEMHVDEECLDCKIPKLTIQPFLENALLHGIHTGKKEICKINVSIVMDEDVIISISDTGRGMSAEQIETLLQDQGGYGVFNVDQRIRLFSGHKEDCGVHVRSQLGKFTTVMVQLKRVI